MTERRDPEHLIFRPVRAGRESERSYRCLPRCAVLSKRVAGLPGPRPKVQFLPARPASQLKEVR